MFLFCKSYFLNWCFVSVRVIFWIGVSVRDILNTIVHYMDVENVTALMYLPLLHQDWSTWGRDGSTVEDDGHVQRPLSSVDLTQLTAGDR